ncbi:cell wall hydrolase [Singulisphaera sp. PoT]|uniref:cell wall hydrolase n=1 Tax=Singulisphaera sp. PoT TaxID=3411797 RepID=UPI003BF5C2DF
MTDVDVLARTLFGEARGESRIGMIAVANVVMNRVAARRWWGRTVPEVCQKPYQFSCWNQNDPNRAVILAVNASHPIFAQALAIAADAVAGTLADVTNGAVAYYARGTPQPKWAAGHIACAEIGHHIFFDDIQ